MLAFGFFLYPIAEHSFNVKASQKLFLARTSDDNLLKKKESKYTKEENFPESVKSDPSVLKEVRKHRAIALKPHDNILLYLANTLGWFFPPKIWSKQKKLQYMLEEAADRIEAKLNIVKMAKNQTDLKVLMRNSMLNEDV